MAAITLDELLKETEICAEKLNQSTSDEHLRAIAIFLTSWRTVAAFLGLSENDLDAVERQWKDEQDRRLNVLQRWKGMYGFKATYRKLVEVLLSLAKADIAERICRLLKGISPENLRLWKTRVLCLPLAYHAIVFHCHEQKGGFVLLT